MRLSYHPFQKGFSLRTLSQRQRVLSVILLMLLLFASLLPLLTTVWAGTPTPSEVEAVARTLYCPLCVGERLDACEIPLCMDMKKEIAKQLAEGKTPEEIRQYFVAQYGPIVLGEPPKKGFNWLAWIIPFIALVGAGGYVFLRIRQWSQPPPATETVAREERTAAEAMDEPLDEYAQQVERELSQWE